MTTPTLISATSCPALFSCIEMIFADNYVSPDEGGEAIRSTFQIPDEYAARLPQIEATLSRLSAGDLEEFAIGNIDSVLNAHPELLEANNLLNHLFGPQE